MVLDEGIEVYHETLFCLELHQVGQILNGLGHQLQSPVCYRTGRVCMGVGSRVEVKITNVEVVYEKRPFT